MRVVLVALAAPLALGCQHAAPATAEAAPPTAAPAPAPAPVPTASEALARLGEDFWEEGLRHSPTSATYLGDRRYDAALDDLSDEGRRRHREALEGFLRRLAALDAAALSPAERITADVLGVELESELAVDVCRKWLWDVDQLGGPQVTLAELPQYHSVSELAQGRSLVTRYQTTRTLFSQQIDNLRRGLAEGYAAPKINVERVVRQLEEQLAVPVEKSPYLDTLGKLPASLADADRATLTAELTAAVREGVYGGLADYARYLKDEYLPRARAEVGVGRKPQGEACYAALIQHHLGTPWPADELHRLGLSELQRIHAEMRKLSVGKGGGKSLRQLYERLQKDRKQYAKRPAEILTHNEALLAAAQAALPRAFGRLPTTPIEVKALEPFREKDAPAGFYYEAPEDGSRPAYYYVNTHDPSQRPLYGMAALAFHEAVPGHHLQIALANENRDLPRFRRRLGASAFVEGWALYAEGLADELGLYRTVEEKLGALSFEAFRAARLVVDTGLHAKGWTREQALAFLRENTLLSDAEAANEIDRYIIWPGQALAYKVGQLEIRKLRALAREQLGARYDDAGFHDAVLREGAIPLPTLRRSVEAFIAARLAEKPGEGGAKPDAVPVAPPR